MRVLTTAINKGEHKVPEGHKCLLYALAPGDAMVLEQKDKEVERHVMQITPAAAKQAKYLYLLSWLEGRTVAEFQLWDLVVAQPTQDDPIPKKKRGQHAEAEDEPVSEESLRGDRSAGIQRADPQEEAGGGRRDRRARSFELLGADSAGSADVRSGVEARPARADRTAPGKKRSPKRRSKGIPDLL